MAGGDLRGALDKDARRDLVWERKGRKVALDIARGLHFLHSHDVRAQRLPFVFCVHVSDVPLAPGLCCSDVNALHSHDERLQTPGCCGLQTALLPFHCCCWSRGVSRPPCTSGCCELRQAVNTRVCEKSTVSFSCPAGHPLRHQDVQRSAQRVVGHRQDRRRGRCAASRQLQPRQRRLCVSLPLFLCSSPSMYCMPSKARKA